MDIGLQKTSSKATGFAIILICLLSLGLMTWAALGDTGIMDELAHIPAGYGYVRHLDFRLNPEHPPLVKAVAGAPLLFLGLNFPTDAEAWTTAVNGQWDMGAKFFYDSGNNADTIIRVARVGPMLLTILLIIVIYFWSKELLGARWALFPAFLFGLSPLVLAHGHYVTTDIAAALGITVATWTFTSFLITPSRTRLLYAGLAFGFAQITKFSAVLLLPFFIIILFVFFTANIIRNFKGTESGLRLRRFTIQALRHTKHLLLIFIIGFLLVIYPTYGLFTLGYPIEKQTSDTEFILSSFADGPNAFQECFSPSSSEQKTFLKVLKVPARCNPVRGLADLDIAMTKNHITRPLSYYALGVLMVLQRSAGGNTGYFNGEVSAAGWTSYFPTVYLLKEPIPVLLLTLIAFLVSTYGVLKALVRRRSHLLDYLDTSFPEFAMMTFIVFYWIYSIRSPLNIGFRHLMPVLPFTYILVASALKRWNSTRPALSLEEKTGSVKFWAKITFGQSLKIALVLALSAWFFAETVAASPYYLSYFNEFAGGTKNGYRYVTDSNYDWGQDLLRLQSFVAQHPEIDKIAVDYFGAGRPTYYLGDCSSASHGAQCAENWWSARGNPTDENIHYLAVSVNTLEGAVAPKAPGFERKPEDEYQWLQELRPPAPEKGSVPEPDFRAGTSIFIYRL